MLVQKLTMGLHLRLDYLQGTFLGTTGLCREDQHVPLCRCRHLGAADGHRICHSEDETGALKALPGGRSTEVEDGQQASGDQERVRR